MSAAQDPSTVELIADVAQVIIGIAAVLSIWIGLTSLRDNRRERMQRVRPWLAFNHGGQMVSCERKRISGLPGYNPAYIHERIGHRPREVRRPTSPWGHLRNHGSGVALSAEVVFVTATATVGKETFRLEPDKLEDFPYEPGLNRIPASPSHIHPGEEAQFFRIPTPIFECEGARQVITGVVLVKCRDIFDREHLKWQRFRVGVEEEGNPKGVLLTFSDEFTPDEARKLLGDLAHKIPELEKTKERSALSEAFRQLAVGGGLVRPNGKG